MHPLSLSYLLQNKQCYSQSDKSVRCFSAIAIELILSHPVMTAIITCHKNTKMESMSDVETLYNSQNLKMPCQCWKQGFVRCRDMSEVGVSVLEV